MDSAPRFLRWLNSVYSGESTLVTAQICLAVFARTDPHHRSGSVCDNVLPRIPHKKFASVEKEKKIPLEASPRSLWR
jgi:hypothetical protein